VVWDVPYEWLVSRFDAIPSKAGRPARTPKQNMETPGITSTRWFDGALLPADDIDQRSPIRALMVFGHGGNTITRLPEAVKGLGTLDLLVVGDPHPTTFSALDARRDGTYLLPICTSLESDGSRTASNRSLQWGEQIVKPAFESKDDYEATYLLANSSASPNRCSSTSRSTTAGRRGGTSCGRSTVAAGRPAIAGIARAPQGAHEAPAEFNIVTLRARQGRARGRRRLLRAAVAVLGHAGAASSRLGHSLQYRVAREGRRQHVPGTVRR